MNIQVPQVLVAIAETMDWPMPVKWYPRVDPADAHTSKIRVTGQMVIAGERSMWWLEFPCPDSLPSIAAGRALMREWHGRVRDHRNRLVEQGATEFLPYDAPVPAPKGVAIKEFAALKGVTRQTVLDWIKRGYVQAERIGPRGHWRVLSISDNSWHSAHPLQQTH